MKQGTFYERKLNYEYMWALTMLVVRTMNEEKRSKKPYKDVGVLEDVKV